MPTFRIVGPGRAGRSMAVALERVGWTLSGLLGREDDITAAARDVDLVIVATPDREIEAIAFAIQPVKECVVAHLSGSLGQSALLPHPRRAAIHPLVSLPDSQIGAKRLAGGAWFAIAGDEITAKIVDDLGGHAFTVADDQRALYHAAACIASNHLVALLGQVARVAAPAGVPLAAYLDLVRETVENVAELGPAAALTGPVARGDHDTIARHIAALDPSERPAYEAMAEAARRLVDDRAC